MNFNTKFKNIQNVVSEDLNNLETDIEKIFTNNKPLDKELLTFLTAPAKRLRPLLGFLLLRSIFKNISEKQKDVLLAVELIHNATLIHDDVIDKAETRRKKDTLNSKFDNDLAVIAGDYLLSIAMEKIIGTESVETFKICTSALKATCLGEINQYFSKFKITSIEEYIEKSREKTAYLFEVGILCGLILNEEKVTAKWEKTAKEFSQNFGIAFQIRDDLINILNSKSIKNPDLNSGIYTAPVIFAYQEDKNILKAKDIAKKLKPGIEKTKNLMDNYFNKSITALSEVEDSIYKRTIIELIGSLRENI